MQVSIMNSSTKDTKPSLSRNVVSSSKKEIQKKIKPLNKGIVG